MCKRMQHHDRISTLQPAATQAYEGDTVRLSQPVTKHGMRRHTCGGAWHLLWLLWPAIALFKSLAATAPHTLSTLAGAWVALLPMLQIVGALTIIAFGVALLHRARRSQGEAYD